MKILRRDYHILFVLSISLSAENDYDDTSLSEAVQLVFDPFNPWGSVNITINNDTLLEEVEFFFGELTTTFSTVILDPQQANISIIDDGRKS